MLKFVTVVVLTSCIFDDESCILLGDRHVFEDLILLAEPLKVFLLMEIYSLK